MGESDPGNLDNIDREIRINELKEKVRELTGEELCSYENLDAPQEIIEQFWRNVAEAEEAEWTSDRKQLERDGVALPPPEQLSDAEIAAKLDEIFLRLAARRTYFLNTNHLSDRQLYEHLLAETLQEEFPDISGISAEGAHIVDLLGGGSEEDCRNYLRYYADEAYRERWHRDFPDDVIPPHEDPPYDRDRRLPPLPEGF